MKQWHVEAIFAASLFTIAASMAAMGADGWGWFLFVGVLVFPGSQSFQEKTVSKLFPKDRVMENSDRDSVKEWASSRKQFTISDVQRAFMWGYNRAQTTVSNLMDDGELKQVWASRGVYYMLDNKA